MCHKDIEQFYKFVINDKSLELMQVFTFQNKQNKLFYLHFENIDKVPIKEYILVKSLLDNKSVLLELKNLNIDSNDNIKILFKDNLLIYEKNNENIVIDFSKKIEQIILEN